MADYSATVNEFGAEATRLYEDGTEVTVRVSAGFVTVEKDGERLLKVHQQQLEEMDVPTELPPAADESAAGGD